MGGPTQGSLSTAWHGCFQSGYFNGIYMHNSKMKNPFILIWANTISKSLSWFCMIKSILLWTSRRYWLAPCQISVSFWHTNSDQNIHGFCYCNHFWSQILTPKISTSCWHPTRQWLFLSNLCKLLLRIVWLWQLTMIRSEPRRPSYLEPGSGSDIISQISMSQDTSSVACKTSASSSFLEAHFTQLLLITLSKC